MLWLNKRNIIILLFLLAAIVFSYIGTGMELSKFLNISNMFTFIREKWLPPAWEVLPSALRETLVTLQMAFLGTIFAVVIAIPISFMAASNTAPSSIYNFTRGMLSFLRSVPEIVFGLVFVTVVGLGPFPAILAIFLHNIGVFGKLISELVEAADRGPQEALRSVGATRTIVSIYAILPQIIPNILSNYFYRLEVAIRTSLILGFIGAGGIGQQLFIHFKIFQYEKVTVDVLVIMLLVIIMDYVSAYIRSKII